MNLHELAYQAGKAFFDCNGHRMQRYLFGKKSFFPIGFVLSDDISDVTFINRIKMMQRGGCRLLGFIGVNSSDLIRQRDLRIGNHG